MSALDLQEVASRIGEEAIGRLGRLPKAVWVNLPDEGKDAVRVALSARAELAIQELAGRNVSRDIAHIEATIANWTWVGASRSYRALVELVKDIAGITFRIVLKGIL